MKPSADPPVRLHENLPYLEVADRQLLDDLFADARAARCLLLRLSETIAIVDPVKVEDLQARLRKLGHTPKVL